jgi:Transposase DDE domain
LIHSPEFIARHRTKNTAFTRDRTLTFPTLMLHGLNLIKGSAQQELDNTLQLIHADSSRWQRVTKSAYTQARHKFSHRAFIEINQNIIQHFYQQSSVKTWRGFRLCAIDGSTVRLPDTDDVIEEFGLHSGRAAQRDVPMAMLSMYYDVLNQIILDADLFPSHTAERQCVQQHLLHAQANDLILFDRGYPGFSLYARLEQQKVAFCMRAKTQLDVSVRNFLRSRKKQAMVTFSPNWKAVNQCAEKQLPTTPITLRLVRVKLKTETEVLITNLLDTELYPAELFKDLYHQRWQIEEQFKRQKQWLEIENFSGRSAEAVRQDFHAKQVTHNLTAMLVHASQIQVDTELTSRQHAYKINFAQALSKMKDSVVLLLLSDDLLQRINKLLHFFAQTVEAVRAHRCFKRHLSNINHNLHYMTYKTCR